MRLRDIDLGVIALLSYMATGVFIWLFVALPIFYTDERYTCDPVGGNWCNVPVSSIWGLPPLGWAIMMGALSGVWFYAFLLTGRPKEGPKSG
jgi:hypothetical protein